MRGIFELLFDICRTLLDFVYLFLFLALLIGLLNSI